MWKILFREQKLKGARHLSKRNVIDGAVQRHYSTMASKDQVDDMR